MSDPAGLVLIEHVNVNVASWDETQRFYEALGCQRAVVQIHMNCGPHTQFHLPLEAPVQLWRGEVTVAYTPEGLAATRTRLAAFAGTADGSGLEISDDASGAGILLRGPWGAFVLREGTPAENTMAALATSRPNTADTIACGVLGIVEISLPVAPGSISEVGKFYSDVMRFQTEIKEGEAVIAGGPVEGSQRIRFQECAPGTTPPDYSGDHFCIYIGDFEGCFERCRELDLLYVNPRFTFLDDSRTLDQARQWQAFRVMDVASQRSAEPLFTEEHEIRSRNHKFLSLPPPKL